MATAFPDLFAALIRPFDKDQVKTRTAPGGRTLSYITARTAANRLDEVLGPENWWDRLVMLSENSFLCELTVRLPDGREVTKGDVGGMAGMADAGDDDKSGASDAFKRACAKYGLGRYLYRDGVPRYDGEAPAPATPSANGRREHEHGDVEDRRDRHPVGTRDSAGQEVPRVHEVSDAPRTGKALFRWAMQMQEKTDHAVLKFLNGYGKSEGFSSDRIVDWTADEVARGYAEAGRKLKETGHATGGHPGDDPNPTRPIDAGSLRKELVQAVWRLARADTGKEKPTVEDYFTAIAQLDPLVEAAGVRLIDDGDVNLCRDPVILSAYLRAARDRLDAAGV